MSFWNNLSLPIIGLSPMDGVTDAPFRFVTAKYGKPHIMFTEFTHVQGLWRGNLEVFKDFLYDEIERPIVAQIFGAEPDYFYKAALIVCELGFDGIDINMGCPASSIVKKGGGASLILNPNLAKEIIYQTKQGVRDWVNGQTLEALELNTEKIQYIKAVRSQHHLDDQPNRQTIPVSVKTRIGFDRVVIKDWVSHLLDMEPAAISMHGRTLKQMYMGNADWEAIGSVASLIHDAGSIYLGNGDVKSVGEASEKVAQYGVDGVLIGRASFGNPWLFKQHVPSVGERLELALEHAQVFAQAKGERRFHEMRKHLAWYCKDFDGAKDLRTQLVQVNGFEDVAAIIAQKKG